MAFEINVDDSDLEDLVEKYIQSRIASQVGEFLRTRLEGVIETKLAAMNLTNGAPIVIEKVINDSLGVVIDARLKAVLPKLIELEIRRRF